MGNTVKDKVVLVTGAGRGIGAAICRRLGRGGARVIATARTESEIQAVVDEIKHYREDSLALPADLRKAEDIIGLVQAVRTKVGRLDALVNNAGVGWIRPISETSLDEWRSLIAVNLDAVFLLTRECLPLFLEQGSGQIVNIGSDASLHGISGMTCYCASKFALRGFTMALREELQGSGIRINLVMPGPVNTSITGEADQPEILQPQDIAEVVWHLMALPPRAETWEVLVESPRRARSV